MFQKKSPFLLAVSHSDNSGDRRLYTWKRDAIRFVPIRRPNNLCRFTFKDKLNLALFAVAVCLVKVGRGGDFLFPHCSGLVCTLAEGP